MRVMFLAALLCLSSFPTVADELKDGDAAVKLADAVMQKASSGDMPAAFDLVRPYVVIPQSELDALLGQVQLQMPMLNGRFGKTTGYELLRNDTVGESLIHVVYLQKFEKHAMVWRFVFYRNDGGWTLNSFKYADDISTVF